MRASYALILAILLVVPDVAAQPRPTSRPASLNQYDAYAMSHQGDAAHGKTIFDDELHFACTRCHGTDGKSDKAGPNLFAIGDKFGRKELIESILRPSSTIAIGYSTTIIFTKDGDAFDGILKGATDDHVALMGGDGRLLRIPTRDIRRRRTSDLSLMPEGLHGALSLQDFTDLVEYLAGLKLPESAAASEHGAPAVIPQSLSPVTLRPFHLPEHRFEHPVWFGLLPGVPNAYAVVEHETGRICILQGNPSRDSKHVFLETARFQTGTRGLLGMVFHPQYPDNGRYFIVKHFNEDGHFHTTLFEGVAAPDRKHDSGQPLRALLRMDATSNVHYGGGLAFGPDGYLYVGMGDTGPQLDPAGNGQNLSVYRGKMLRIDVDRAAGARGYSIPPDNPFIARKDVLPEIFAYGFREPWRFSFDPVTKDLWVGDVGQDLYEEVSIVRPGENHGWNVYEGFVPFSNRYRRENERYTPPIFAYSRKYGVSVTGGFVYRADPKSPLYGSYIFADYQTNRLFSLTQQDRVLKTIHQIGQSPEHPVSFGLDDRGEIYVVGYEGTIYRMDFSTAHP